MVAYLAVDAIEHAIPAHLYSASWWRFTSLPIRTIQFASALWLTCWLFCKCGGRLLYLGLMASMFGAAFTLGAGYWLPADWFHAADMWRQNGYLGLLIGWGMAWNILNDRDGINIRLRRLSAGWVWWLAFQFLGATTGAGGLLWDIVQWKGGEAWWYGVSETSLAGQVAVAIWWLLAKGRP